MPRAALLLLLVPLLALAACGGDDGPSREDYIAEADALCERINEEIEEVNEPEPTDLESLRELLDAGLDLTREGLEELQEIEPPEELEDEVDEFLDTARDQEQALERARDAGTFEEGAQVLREELPPIVEARTEAADEIGFEKCGRG
jgi:hypothetical protein